ncbi:diacylglycerol/lipid kinase family protein [Thalassolituus marinus]|uniref:YegS/Rv2252/BmrU family lipid kinase n=1 Tax=Thalassolituus marinus TaxID=671053 RepID=A0ABS7ZRC2_9GAMM|nr:YegS/Rv2252/BmrU family lipid kinase [Thalassolituus marinus]MCA6064273.1 YegS/Rv2252/BmrU family lipid kinase [Thalassolituus marinus]
MSAVLIIFNPASGQGRQAFVEQVAQSLRELSWDVSLYPTRCAGDATRFLQQYSGPLDVVAVAGGDGTLNEVVNGLSERNSDSYRLALIPTGTTNVLAMELGVQRQLQQIVDIITAGKETTVYPGRVNGRRFMLMAGIGYDAWVVDKVNLKLKKKVGKLAYVLSMLKELRRFGSKTYVLDVDGERHEANSVVITNGRYYGGSFVISRQAGLGKADTQVLMISGRNPLHFLLVLLGLPLGIMEKMPGIRSVSARKVIVHDKDQNAVPEPVQADGDSLATLPLTLEMESTALRVLVP